MYIGKTNGDREKTHDRWSSQLIFSHLTWNTNTTQSSSYLIIYSGNYDSDQRLYVDHPQYFGILYQVGRSIFTAKKSSAQVQLSHGRLEAYVHHYYMINRVI
jgi:hypothetical protein